MAGPAKFLHWRKLHIASELSVSGLSRLAAGFCKCLLFPPFIATQREYRSQCNLFNSHSRFIPAFPKSEAEKSLIAWEHRGTCGSQRWVPQIATTH